LSGAAVLAGIQAVRTCLLQAPASDGPTPGGPAPGHIQDLNSDPVPYSGSLIASTPAPAALATAITSPANTADGTVILQIVTTGRHDAMRHNAATFPTSY
jgi:hypothetical protein